VVVVSSELDDTYLQQRVALGSNDVDGYGLTFSTRDTVLARTGEQPPVTTVLDAGRRAMDSGRAAIATTANRLIAAQPITPEDTPVAAVIVSVPASFVAGTRDDLYRVLFIVALVATLVALVLAAVVGESIGAGVRRLTG